MSIEFCKDTQHPSFLKDYKVAEKKPDHLAIEGLRARINALNNTNYDEAMREAGEVFYMGINPRIQGVLEDSLISREMIEATRQLMKSSIEGIVIVDEGFILNSLKGGDTRSYGNGDIWRIKALRTEARVLGEMQKMLVQAIQEQLILSGQARLEDYKPVVLLSDIVNLDEVSSLFRKIFNLAEENKEVADKLLKCTPAPIKQSNLSLGKRGSKSLRRLRTGIKTDVTMEAPGFSDFLERNGLLDFAKTNCGVDQFWTDETWANEPISALRSSAYTAFQHSVVLPKKRKEKRIKDEPKTKKIKWGFPGEIPYDQVTHFLFKNYAKELDLDSEDTVFETVYIQNETARIPYKATELIWGQSTLFATISMAPSEESGEHCIAEQVSALMNGNIFSILENQLWNIEKNKRLIDKEAWNPSSKELHYQKYFGESMRYQFIKSHPGINTSLGFSPYGRNLFRQILPFSQPVRGELKRLKIMNLLKQLVATLSQDQTLKEVLGQSGVLPILRGEKPISDLHRLNRLNLSLDPLDAFQQKVTEITHLRDEIERLEADCRKYEQAIAFLGKMSNSYKFVNCLEEELETRIDLERERLWQLIASVQEEGKSQNDEKFHECNEAYLIRHMAKAISGVVYNNPELAEALTQFFRRLARVLHPEIELTIDLNKPYWQAAA